MSQTLPITTDEIERFFGCYLLVSRNEQPRIKGSVYIGFSVDPTRRIRQHNGGTKAGGAWKTSQRGPWDMIVMVHGFPNQISALRFEWAWQHPSDSRRLKNLNLKKKSKEKQLDFRLRVLAHMLRSGPWNRLSLTVRWLKEEYRIEFPPDLQPPSTVRIKCGPVKAIKPSTTDISSTDREDTFCRLCYKTLQKVDKISCPISTCQAPFHILCLAREFLKSDHTNLLPIDGECPKCSTIIFWTEIMKTISISTAKVQNEILLS